MLQSRSVYTFQDAEPVHIFEDLTGRRQKILPAIGYMTLLILVIFVSDLIWRISNLPTLAELNPAPIFQEVPILTPFPNDLPPSLIYLQTDTAATCGSKASPAQDMRRTVAAFVPADNPTAASALASHCGDLNLILAQAFVFGAPDGTVEPLQQVALTPTRAAGPAVYAVVGPRPDTSVATIEAVLGSFRALARMGADLAGQLDKSNAAGVCLDLSGVQGLSSAMVLKAITALRADAVRSGQDLCLIGTVDAPFWDDAALVNSIDLAVLRAFQEPTTPTGLPASDQWIKTALDHLRGLIPAEKRIVALGGFGYAWQSGRADPERLTYAETMYRLSVKAGSLGFAPDLGAAKIRYTDADRRLNDVWLLDAVTFHNQIRQLDPTERVAVWPLGYEDPAIWALLSGGEARAADVLNGPVTLDHLLRVEGAGPLATEISSAVPGQRSVTQDPATGLITAQAYDILPVPPRILRGGSGPAGTLSLTFDGLPTAANLPALLDILTRAHVNVTFFVDGRTMLARGEGAAQIRAAGHAVGMIYADAGPTLSLFTLGAEVIDNGTQMMIAQQTAERTLFVREPLDDNPLPASTDDLLVLGQQRAAGYLPVVTGISAPYGPFDPQDFVDRVGDEAMTLGADVLTFDLNADNDDAVLAVLPAVLSGLHADGLTLGPLRLTAGDAPPLTTTPPRLSDAVAFSVIGFFQSGLTSVFLWLMVIAAVRSLIYLGLALWRGTRSGFDPDFQPPVTVIVPAYNEEKVIEKCLESILRSDYANFRIVVVDDGSTDATSQVVTQRFGTDNRVVLMHEANRGKWHASNYGLTAVDTPYFIIADADSLFFPDTIRWLVQQFKDDSVGAVAGLVEVGNHENLLTACQRIEYIVSQSVMRRAYEAFEGILVVPGAVGAWRTEAVIKAHAFSGETITEDADLTVAVHRAGYRVRFQEQARSVTEAPETVRAFMRQRLRWTFGMLEVSWKHRGAIAERRAVGLSIIDAIWFGLVSCLLSPLVDVLLVLLLVKGIFLLVSGGALTLSGFPTVILLSYFFLTAIDMANTLAAFWFERHFQWKLLLLVPFLRFGYRQLLYISTLRAIWHALSGHMAGWNKLERTGAVFAQPLPDRGQDRAAPRPQLGLAE